ncbi:MAG: hypothetical protein ACR2FL_02055 [Nocardioidaceae bacterium]
MAAASTEPARGGLPSPTACGTSRCPCDAKPTSRRSPSHTASPSRTGANSIGPGWHYYYFLDRLGAVISATEVPDTWDDYYPFLRTAYLLPD